MWKNIKSIYFIKFIFVHVDEKQKLKIVKCNKSLQKNIDISIINYKLFTGKYIIYESNRIAKEYLPNGKLLFEGEYLNGKRNGKAKEYYDNGELEFEGEYLNDKRNGKGKKYYENGKLKFEGQYLKIIKNGLEQGIIYLVGFMY